MTVPSSAPPPPRGYEGPSFPRVPMHAMRLSVHFTSVYSRGVNRAGPNAGGGPGLAERFYNLLEIRAGFLQSFTRTINKVNGNSAFMHCIVKFYSQKVRNLLYA